MFRPKKFLCYLKNKHRGWLTLMATVAPALLLAATNASAASGAAAERKGPVRLLFTVPVPVAAINTTGGMYGFDISFVDQSNQTYYLGDRSNAAVDVVDASTGTFVKQITASPPFAGVQLNAAGTAVNNNISGPNGVATDGSGTCLFAGDGPSRVVSFKLPGGTQVSDVNTGGTTRADEMAFDPKDRLLLVVNNAETPPFATLISVGTDCTLTLGQKIVFDFATNGAEQPAWDPGTQRFYQSIPSTSGTIASPGTTGAVVRINPLTASVETQFAVPLCGPAGLALNPTNETFLVGCNTVYDTTGAPWSGTSANTANPVQVVIDVNGVFAFVTGIGSSDEVWYNAGDNHWYTGSSGSPYAPSVVVSGATAVEQGAAILGVIDGTSQILDQIVPTFNVPNVPPLLGPPPGHPSGTSHSVAANAANNWVFVPLPANNAISGCLTGCIGVYGRNDADLVGAND
jgi:sugar lactone lactonase YvrE